MERAGLRENPVSVSAPQFLVLSGELAPTDVGTVMAVIAMYRHRPPSGDGVEHADPGGLIQGIIRADGLVAPGGLTVRDTAAGLTVNPSCCCGLEDWQEWSQLAAGKSLWLGHSPSAWAEHLGPTIRVWPDGGDKAAAPVGSSPIEIPADDLPDLIEGVHRRLQGFLDLVDPWAIPLAGGTAAGLGSTLAEHFHISWPAPDRQTGS